MTNTNRLGIDWNWLLREYIKLHTKGPYTSVTTKWNDKKLISSKGCTFVCYDDRAAQ